MKRSYLIDLLTNGYKVVMFDNGFEVGCTYFLNDLEVSQFEASLISYNDAIECGEKFVSL